MNEKDLKDALKKSKRDLQVNWKGSDRVWRRIESSFSQRESKFSFDFAQIKYASVLASVLILIIGLGIVLKVTTFQSFEEAKIADENSSYMLTMNDYTSSYYFTSESDDDDKSDSENSNGEELSEDESENGYETVI